MERAVGRSICGGREDDIVDSIVSVAEDKMKCKNAKEGGDVIAEAGILRIGIIDETTRDPSVLK